MDKLHFMALSEKLKEMGFILRFYAEPKLTGSELNSYLIYKIGLSMLEDFSDEFFVAESAIDFKEAFKIFKKKLFNEEIEIFGTKMSFEFNSENEEITINYGQPAYT